MALLFIIQVPSLTMFTGYHKVRVYHTLTLSSTVDVRAIMLKVIPTTRRTVNTYPPPKILESGGRWGMEIAILYHIPPSRL